MYLGGTFAAIAGQPRASLAAVHATTGAVLDWRADASHTDYFGSTQRARIYSLAIVGDVLYVGGLFDTINGTRRAGLAALDANTGAVLPWNPGLMDPFHQFPLDEAIIYVITPHDDGIYVGGRFRAAGALPVTSLALFPGVPEPPPPPPDRVVLESLSPNPATSASRVRFALPGAGRVTLEVFDLQGRRMAAPLRDEPRSAGMHEVVVATDRWPEGAYFCRLLAGSEAFSRKLVVVR